LDHLELTTNIIITYLNFMDFEGKHVIYWYCKTICKSVHIFTGGNREHKRSCTQNRYL